MKRLLKKYRESALVSKITLAAGMVLAGGGILLFEVGMFLLGLLLLWAAL